jgi:hypothetical protein
MSLSFAQALCLQELFAWLSEQIGLISQNDIKTDFVMHRYVFSEAQINFPLRYH